MTTVPRTTTVPAVTDALVTAFRAIEDDDLEVQDGPKPKPKMRKCIAVGVGPEGISHRVTPDRRAGGWVYNEAFDIVCVLWSWGGKTTETAEHRSNCGTLLSQVRTAVDALNEANLSQGIVFTITENLAWIQSYAGEGSACQVGFAVHATATI